MPQGRVLFAPERARVVTTTPNSHASIAWLTHMNISRNILLLAIALVTDSSIAQQLTWAPCLVSQPSAFFEREKSEEVCAREQTASLGLFPFEA